MWTAIMYNNSHSLLEFSTQNSSDRISETGHLATNVYMNFFVTSGLKNSLLRERPPFFKHPLNILYCFVFMTATCLACDFC
jgi:hypothetical protein